jgi:hypothetical protein
LLCGCALPHLCPHPCAASACQSGSHRASVAMPSGGNLFAVASERRGRPFPERDIVAMFLPVARAIAYVHSLHPPIAHRDVKVCSVVCNSLLLVSRSILVLLMNVVAFCRPTEFPLVYWLSVSLCTVSVCFPLDLSRSLGPLISRTASRTVLCSPFFLTLVCCSRAARERSRGVGRLAATVRLRLDVDAPGSHQRQDGANQGGRHHPAVHDASVPVSAAAKQHPPVSPLP